MSHAATEVVSHASAPLCKRKACVRQPPSPRPTKAAKRAKGAPIYPAVAAANDCLLVRSRGKLPEQCLMSILGFAFESCTEQQCRATTPLEAFSYYKSCMRCDNTCESCSKFDCNLDRCGDWACTAGEMCFECLTKCDCCSTRWCQDHLGGMCGACGRLDLCRDCTRSCAGEDCEAVLCVDCVDECEFCSESFCRKCLTNDTCWRCISVDSSKNVLGADFGSAAAN